MEDGKRGLEGNVANVEVLLEPMPIVNERRTTMTKKQAGVIALIAFVALIRPCSNMFTFADLLWSVVFKTGMMNTPYMRLCVFMFDRFGRGAAELTGVAIIWTIAVFVAMVIYRYLRRRDFAQVCADCAAHKVWAWLAFAAFLLFSFTSLSRAFYPVGCDQAELPLDEVMEHNPTATPSLPPRKRPP